MSSLKDLLLFAMADPGFYRRGGEGANSKGGHEKLLICPLLFPKNGIKMKEVGPRRDASLVPPPPLGSVNDLR